MLRTQAHPRSLEIFNTTEDKSVVIELSATDPDTEYLSLTLVELPTKGKLYTMNADGTKGTEIQQYSEWEVGAPGCARNGPHSSSRVLDHPSLQVPTPLEQYVVAVEDGDGDRYAVSTFWPASLADNGLPKWHRAFAAQCSESHPFILPRHYTHRRR